VTKTSLTVKKSGAHLKAAGKVTGGVPAVKVSVELERRSAVGKWTTVSTHSAILSSTKTYKSTISRAKAGSCRAIARYPGSAQTAASSATKTFTC
jgi:hypothetical protein